ncbi:Y-family DNA polymerase [Sphingomonas xanthus]|uniref:DNA polymerase Y family protein n=1 Tax=Sphingomonas xanthus TaxID=2594473 RepID=A0A516IUK7_9SPHN|nr:DNA polymerase Y family protein [Sphingomonas xanthus]QDP20561.1 DNA polymerase Y family protein [Sphingomonas xanthus]
MPNDGAAGPEAGQPFVLTAKVKGALRLAAVDRGAGALGLVPGMTLSDARARVPGLASFTHDPAADLGWLERLADGCLRYSPMVAADPPDGLLLDIAGCAHLFGGEAGLVADLDDRLDRLGLHRRMAFAGTQGAARALARYQALPAADEAAAVRRLPVTALELGDDATLALTRAGLNRVGELAVRPMASVAARFGAETVAALRHVLGEEERPIVPRQPAVPVAAERRFAEPIARTDDALTVLGELVGEAAEQMERRRLGGRRFEGLLFRSDGIMRTLVVETSRPSRDPALVVRLMAERIEALADPIDPGFGFDLIRLRVPVTEPLAAAQLAMEGGAAADVEVDSLVDRLSIRLGRERVRRLVPLDTHIPEQMQLELPAVGTSPSKAEWPRPEPGEPPLRPLHLFDPPQRIEVVAEVPDGPPHRFRWRRKLHEVRRFEGPERIASEWWKRRDGEVDRPGLTRDYYRVEDAHGRRFWLFRHGLYAEKADPGWYVHGLFA